MSTTNMAAAVAPKSDQLNADDLMAGPITVTISNAYVNPDSEQPAVLELTERPGKPYKPGRSMSRVLVAAWGPDTSRYVGQKLTLYRDPNVKFGGILVGGIRISHMSGIAKPLSVALTVTRGKKGAFTVQPLIEQAPKPTVTDEQIAGATTVDELRDLYKAADPMQQQAIIARKAELEQSPSTEGTVE